MLPNCSESELRRTCLWKTRKAGTASIATERSPDWPAVNHRTTNSKNSYFVHKLTDLQDRMIVTLFTLGAKAHLITVAG